MDLNQANILALDLMSKHGLSGWTFRFDDSKRRFGVCRSSLKEIALSLELTKLNPEEQVKDTLLHEVAHALCGPGVGHGWQWKRMARHIGANPLRCYDSATVVKPILPLLCRP